MPNDRRAFIPGGVYFFTVKTELHAPVYGELTAVRLLGIILREAKRQWPFDISILLPWCCCPVFGMRSGRCRREMTGIPRAWIEKELVKEAGGSACTFIGGPHSGPYLAALCIKCKTSDFSA